MCPIHSGRTIWHMVQECLIIAMAICSEACGLTMLLKDKENTVMLMELFIRVEISSLLKVIG